MEENKSGFRLREETGYFSLEGVDGATFSTASLTDAGTAPNTITYTLNDNTKAENYEITKVEGTLTVDPLPVAGAGAMRLGGQANWVALVTAAIGLGYLVLRLVESLKLAKAFGKGIGTGILLTFFQALGRFGLSMTKSEYHRPPA